MHLRFAQGLDFRALSLSLLSGRNIGQHNTDWHRFWKKWSVRNLFWPHWSSCYDEWFFVCLWFTCYFESDLKYIWAKKFKFFCVSSRSFVFRALNEPLLSTPRLNKIICGSICPSQDGQYFGMSFRDFKGTAPSTGSQGFQGAVQYNFWCDVTHLPTSFWSVKGPGFAFYLCCPFVWSHRPEQVLK